LPVKGAGLAGLTARRSTNFSAACDAFGTAVRLLHAEQENLRACVQATCELRRREGSPPVLALTTFDDDDVLAGVLRAGAAGFVLKDVSAEDLHRAVRVDAGGGAWLDPAVTGRVLATYRSAPPPRAGRDPALDALTSREREVLALIGQGKTNTEIAAGLFVSDGTVKTHINHLFTKLQLRDRAAAVVFAFDHDLVTPAPDSPSGGTRRSQRHGPGHPRIPQQGLVSQLAGPYAPKADDNACRRRA
jgi:DNA-binding NarL/FixJ family response regulator